MSNNKLMLDKNISYKYFSPGEPHHLIHFEWSHIFLLIEFEKRLNLLGNMYIPPSADDRAPGQSNSVMAYACLHLRLHD